MSDKPKVYQGVRVKTTVKELLQRYRAREANGKKVKTISQPCFDLQDLCASTLPTVVSNPAPYVDAPSTAAPPVDVGGCGAPPMHAAPFHDGSCSIQVQDGGYHGAQRQYGDMMLPVDGYSVNSNNNNNNNSSSSSCCYNNLPPAAALPLSWCHGLSSDADYYGMAPCSPSESLKLCSPMDHNSYSPQDSFSSSSSCYDSPTRMEYSFPGLTSEHYHYQHCNLQDCYCLAHCWPGQQESFSTPEYASYYAPTDYPYTCPVEENYFKSNSAMSPEMCYNVL